MPPEFDQLAAFQSRHSTLIAVGAVLVVQPAVPSGSLGTSNAKSTSVDGRVVCVMNALPTLERKPPDPQVPVPVLLLSIMLQIFVRSMAMLPMLGEVLK